jgi:hypothetical protein
MPKWVYMCETVLIFTFWQETFNSKRKEFNLETHFAFVDWKKVLDTCKRYLILLNIVWY